MIIPEKSVVQQGELPRELRCRTDGPVISGQHVRLASHPIVVTDKQGDGVPSISIRREGNTIREIHVRCGCGELLIVDCEYAGEKVAMGQH